MVQMPVIEERESESDVKEELERKEKDYLRNIERLEETLDDLKRSYEQSQSQIDILNQTVIDYEPGDLLELRDKEVQQLEQELLELESQNIAYQQKNDLVIEIMRYKQKFQHDLNAEIVITEEDIDNYVNRFRELLKKEKVEYSQNQELIQRVYSIDRFDYDQTW